jgi:hypothetical protein
MRNSFVAKTGFKSFRSAACVRSRTDLQKKTAALEAAAGNVGEKTPLNFPSGEQHPRG